VSKFDVWFSDSFRWWDYPQINAFPSLEEGAECAWDYQQERIQEVIERLEEYPCCMSCYLSVAEMKAAKQVKEKFISILKGELL
tara:strand:- start:168 stop:419 length:252 start_codon:yes stop_codon:yes gene_type:complete